MKQQRMGRADNNNNQREEIKKHGSTLGGGRAEFYVAMCFSSILLLLEGGLENGSAAGPVTSNVKLGTPSDLTIVASTHLYPSICKNCAFHPLLLIFYCSSDESTMKLEESKWRFQPDPISMRRTDPKVQSRTRNF